MTRTVQKICYGLNTICGLEYPDFYTNYSEMKQTLVKGEVVEKRYMKGEW